MREICATCFHDKDYHLPFQGDLTCSHPRRTLFNGISVNLICECNNFTAVRKPISCKRCQKTIYDAKNIDTVYGFCVDCIAELESLRAEVQQKS